ncbi:MAG: hypothetical protein ABR886_06565 [Dehalococcoidales bacterium]|jgi:hypothetical protein
MAVAVVTILCIILVVVGGMTLSQGILTSADTSAISVNSISVRQGDIMRTGVATIRAAELAWGDYLRVTVKNCGQTRLASFDKWDIIVSYADNSNKTYSSWLKNTADRPGSNQWQEARIGLEGPTEFFEPGILNPAEEMVILARLDPPPAPGTEGVVSVTTPNGVESSLPFAVPGRAFFTPESEGVTINAIRYYELVEASPADRPGTTLGTQFAPGETGRKILSDLDQSGRSARYVYPLIGINSIPAATWTAYYHCYVAGDGGFPASDNETCFNMDIIVRQADGAARAVIATGAASVYFNKDAAGTWVTISGSYDFPGYIVIDPNDYLEIDYYGQTTQGPDSAPGYLQLSIDNSGLAATDQTRIES